MRTGDTKSKPRITLILENRRDQHDLCPQNDKHLTVFWKFGNATLY
jgi:hypothetical protein